MANQKVGRIWGGAKGAMPNSRLANCDVNALPVAGDLCYFDTADADGTLEYMPTTVAASSIELRTIAAICVHERIDGILYNPGRREEFGQQVNTIGGRGSKTLTNDYQRMVVPVTPELTWLMSRGADTAVVVGQGYGLTRVGAGDYVLNPADAQDVVTVVGIYKNDLDAGIPASGGGGTVARVWVKASNAGGERLL